MNIISQNYFLYKRFYTKKKFINNSIVYYVNAWKHLLYVENS